MSQIIWRAWKSCGEGDEEGRDVRKEGREKGGQRSEFRMEVLLPPSGWR